MLNEIKKRIEDICTDDLADVLTDVVFGEFNSYEAANSLEIKVLQLETEKEFELANDIVRILIGYSIDGLIASVKDKEV